MHPSPHPGHPTVPATHRRFRFPLARPSETPLLPNSLHNLLPSLSLCVFCCCLSLAPPSTSIVAFLFGLAIARTSWYASLLQTADRNMRLLIPFSCHKDQYRGGLMWKFAMWCVWVAAGGRAVFEDRAVIRPCF